MKYIYLFIALICIIHGLTVHAIPHAEYTKRGESCNTNADCSDGAECIDKTCTSTVHPDCCWMPPIYCCGPLKYSP
ncbi:hypothetical protein C2G38_2113666 [Gigaspora rosea]|uniref:Granulins domain-containing protein n=1 Tax=Gigaspora rosea TaxID=44941 RepID=A0A397UB06_9GLOM|nr:hypothetical protein C2G38_2113666 [Gigaspora rosea]